VAQGTTTIAVGTPAGFITPANYTQVTATVNAPNITIGNVGVGKDLQTSVGVTLGITPPSPVTVTVTIRDSNLAVISSDPAVAGTGTVTFSNVTSSYAGTVYVQGLAVGSTVMTAQAAGYNNGTNTVQVDPSGFVLDPYSVGNFATTTFSPNTTIRVSSARLSPTNGQWNGNQTLRPGVTASVAVTSDDANVGVITVSPVTLTSSAASATTAFTPRTAGTARISVNTPAGFSAPANYTQVTATVNAPGINVPNVTVGRDLQASVFISLAVTPPSPVSVTVTSSNPGLVLLSTNPAAAGSSSVTFTNVSGTSVGTVYVQGLGLGSVAITAQTAGYNDGSGSVVVGPSGFVVYPTGNFTTSATAGNTNIQIAPARLDPGTLNYSGTQALRGGLTVSVPVTSSNSAVGVIVTSPVVFSGGATSVTTAFDPLAVGSTEISITQPVGSGFSTPSNYQKITATVQ